METANDKMPYTKLSVGVVSKAMQYLTLREKTSDYDANKIRDLVDSWYAGNPKMFTIENGVLVMSG